MARDYRIVFNKDNHVFWVIALPKDLTDQMKQGLKDGFIEVFNQEQLNELSVTPKLTQQQKQTLKTKYAEGKLPMWNGDLPFAGNVSWEDISDRQAYMESRYPAYYTVP